MEPCFGLTSQIGPAKPPASMLRAVISADAAGPPAGADQRHRARPQQELKVTDRHDVLRPLQRDCLPMSFDPDQMAMRTPHT